MDLTIKRIEQRPIGTNCYIISDGRGSIVIDPGSEVDIPSIKESIRGDLYAVILTHLHFDHSAAAHLLDAPLYLHEKELEDIEMQKRLTLQALGRPLILPEEIHHLKEEETFGDIHFKVLHTPGHTKGGSCLLFDDFLITGDTLFAGTYGRTDLGGNDKDMDSSLRFLAQLPEELVVYPGHGEPTTIKEEKKWILNNSP
ncbi:MAG: MBL fold metallo-hydrolase [Nanoarchaeota archaeon]|nr:MBL fold metallo-hydrolase [Nanoarchaeota archaeon]